MAADIHLPNAVRMMEEFQADPFAIQSLLVVHTLALGASRLVWGPLCEKFGVRRILNVASTLSLAGLLVSAISQSVAQLWAGRIVMSLGGGALVVLVLAIVSQSASGSRLVARLSLFELAYPVGFVLAPLIGAIVGDVSGWRSAYLLLCALQCALLLAVRKQPLLKAEGGWSFGSSIVWFGTLLRDRSFLLATLCSISVSATYLVFVSGAPFVFMNEFGATPSQYAIYQCIPLLTYALTLLFYRKGAQRLEGKLGLSFGLVGYGVFSAYLLMALSGIMVLNAPILTLTMCIQSCAAAILITGCNALALDVAGEHKSLAASLLATARAFFVALSVGLSSCAFHGLWSAIASLLIVSVCVLFLGGFLLSAGTVSDRQLSIPE